MAADATVAFAAAIVAAIRTLQEMARRAARGCSCTERLGHGTSHRLSRAVSVSRNEIFEN